MLQCIQTDFEPPTRKKNKQTSKSLKKSMTPQKVSFVSSHFETFFRHIFGVPSSKQASICFMMGFGAGRPTVAPPRAPQWVARTAPSPSHVAHVACAPRRVSKHSRHVGRGEILGLVAIQEVLPENSVKLSEKFGMSFRILGDKVGIG